MEPINPARYLAYKKEDISFEEYVLQELEALIRQKIAEIKSAPLKNASGLVEALNHLVKTYLLLSGKPTDRQERVQKLDTNITLIVEELRRELGDYALYDLDVKAFEVLDERTKDQPSEPE